jgi:hypothetical protein
MRTATLDRACRVWIIPSFNPEMIYHGWHLYERPNNDPDDKRWKTWDWIRGALRLEHVRNLLVREGLDLPSVSGGIGAGISEGNLTIDAFVRRFPNGVRVWKDYYRDYWLKKP